MQAVLMECSGGRLRLLNPIRGAMLLDVGSVRSTEVENPHWAAVGGRNSYYAVQGWLGNYSISADAAIWNRFWLELGHQYSAPEKNF